MRAEEAESEPSASQLLRDLAAGQGGAAGTLAELSHTLHGRGFALLLLVLALPMALPLPWPPGFSSLISLPLVFFTLQMALGARDVWLPPFLARKRISPGALATVAQHACPWLERGERWLRPHGAKNITPGMERAVGAFSLVLAGCILLPLSFLSNTIPAAGISIMALGLLERNTRALGFGALVGLVGLAITVAVVVLGFELALAAFERI